MGKYFVSAVIGRQEDAFGKEYNWTEATEIDADSHKAHKR